MYLTFSNLNSIHWLIKKKKKMYRPKLSNELFRTFSGHFMTIFRSNYFPLKKKIIHIFFNIL